MGIIMMPKAIFSLLLILATQWVSAQKYVAHDVQEGETPRSIAKQYEIEVDDLLSINAELKKGEKIAFSKVIVPVKKVPDNANEIEFTIYKVSPKETLYSIARSYNLKVGDIKDFNPYLYDRELNVRDKLKIPVVSLDRTNGDSKKDFNQSVTNSSFGKLKHLVMPKETKYGIAKKYGISVERLEELNPGMGELQSGQFVDISRGDDTKSDVEKAEKQTKKSFKEEIKFYRVSGKESIKSIQKEYDFSEERLEALNPALRYGGLSEGMVLKLPIKQKTLLMPGEKHVNLENHINYLEAKQLVLMLPLSLQQFEKDSVDKSFVLKRDRLSRIALDFYSGAKIAIDSAAQIGINTRLKVYDTQRSADRVNQIMHQNDFTETQAIIGPFLDSSIQEVIKNLDTLDTPVISPLLNPRFSKENLFKTIPSADVMQETLLTYLDSVHTEENIAIISDSITDENVVRKIQYTFPDAQKVTQEEKDYIQKKDIKKHLKKDEMNWVFLETSDLGLIESSVSYLNSLYKDDYQIQLFTTNRESAYEDEISNHYLSRLKFTFPAISREFVQPVKASFVEKFKEENGYYPNKYVVRGFDITYDILLRLAFSEDFEATMNLESYTEYFENKFHYKKEPLGASFQNEAIYLIQYDDELQTKVLNE
ncbi:MAG: LysM peptidoglycan-binding domain-containing protein [Bacteroidota bacterium]